MLIFARVMELNYYVLCLEVNVEFKKTMRTSIKMG